MLRVRVSQKANGFKAGDVAVVPDDEATASLVRSGVFVVLAHVNEDGSDDRRHLNKVQLQAQLKERGLDASGDKAELLQRLEAAEAAG